MPVGAATDEASLLTVFRDSLVTNFGDHGLASSAMSLTGTARQSSHEFCLPSHPLPVQPPSFHQALISKLPVSAVKYYNPVTNICMLRCGFQEYRQVNGLCNICNL